MPFVSVDYFAGISDAERTQLQERLAKVVMEQFNAPATNVRVFTRAFNPADVYLASGQTETGLPVIRVEFLPGRTLAQKRGLVKGLAPIAAEIFKVPVSQIRIILYERQLEEWARGDTLMADA